MATDNSNANRSTSAREVSCRFEAAIDLFPTKRGAADALGISTDQLARYIKGEASPTLAVLMRLSSVKGISLDWLSTGSGEMVPAQDEAKQQADHHSLPGAIREDDRLYQIAAETILKWYDDHNLTTTPETFGKMMSLCVRKLRSRNDTSKLSDDQVTLEFRHSLDIAREMLQEASFGRKKG